MDMDFNFNKFMNKINEIYEIQFINNYYITIIFKIKVSFFYY